MMEPLVERVCEFMRTSRRVVVMTGAGTSAESGIPTFREAQTGLWAKFRPEELATPQAFEADPERVWNWYAWRRELVRKALPNSGHKALAAMASKVETFTLVTQNVDSLHQRAGNTDVLELHGNILRSRCHATGKVVSDDTLTGAPPASPFAEGGLVRPDVVWFGEALPEAILAAAVEASSKADIFFSVGTSSQVEPAASLARLAASAGAKVVEINPEETPLTAHADVVLRGKSAELLPRIVAGL